MKKKVKKDDQDKQEIINIATGCVLGIIISVIIIGATLAGMALYSYLKYWR